MQKQLVTTLMVLISEVQNYELKLPGADEEEVLEVEEAEEDLEVEVVVVASEEEEVPEEVDLIATVVAEEKAEAVVEDLEAETLVGEVMVMEEAVVVVVVEALEEVQGGLAVEDDSVPGRLMRALGVNESKIVCKVLM